MPPLIPRADGPALRRAVLPGRIVEHQLVRRRPLAPSSLLARTRSLTRGAQRRFHQAFADLGRPPHVYLAINAEDSNIVYYKLSPGIVKPPV